MGIVQREINGRAIYEAIKVNGAQHIREGWFQFDGAGNPVGGCALGLAAINLKVAGMTSINADANIYSQLKPLAVPLTSKWHLANAEEIAAGINVHPGTIESSSNVADTIIFWNDTTVHTDGELRYVLSSWEEVHQMVHDILEPYFANTFTVDVWEFDAPDFSAFNQSEAEPSLHPSRDDDDYDEYDSSYAY